MDWVGGRKYSNVIDGDTGGFNGTEGSFLERYRYNTNMNIIGHKRRIGLLGAKRTTITVHRSEEILPAEGGGGIKPQLIRVTSVSSEGDLANAELVEQAGDDR